ANVRAGRVTVSVDIDAPKEGRPKTRVNWLLKQLREAPAQLTVEAWVRGARTSMSELLSDVREDPNMLVQDAKKDVVKFRVSASTPLGITGNLKGNSFIETVLGAATSFYREVIENLVPWTPPVAKLPTEGRTATEAAGIDTRPAISDFTASELRVDQKGRQGVFARPSAPIEPPQWIVESKPLRESPSIEDHS
ncbi:MAG: hypothetical protein P8O03_01785, partial [Ilumatobacter sp.]|nr:hypothetical protein [Ilumatobacter sp.]